MGYPHPRNQNFIGNYIELCVVAYATDNERIILRLYITPAGLKFIGINSYDNKEMYSEVYEMNKKYLVDPTKEIAFSSSTGFTQIRATYVINGCEYDYKATQGWFMITDVQQEEDKEDGLFISGEFAFTAVDEESGDILTIENGSLDNIWLYSNYGSIDFDNRTYSFY